MAEPLMPPPVWLNVSRETLEALTHFGQMVGQWTAKINLVSPATLPDLWHRHIIDSAQLFESGNQGAVWADLGSGGGFPGIVLAVMGREFAPEAEFHLVESDQRKAAFLRKASQELGLRAKIHASRSESLPPLMANTVTARALAPLDVLLGHAMRHLGEGGRAILPKGARAGDEIEAARRLWVFNLEIRPSRTDPNAQVLLIENLRHV